MVAWKSLDEVLDEVFERGWKSFYLCMREDGKYIAFEHKGVLTHFFDTLFFEAYDREEVYRILKQV